MDTNQTLTRDTLIVTLSPQPHGAGSVASQAYHFPADTPVSTEDGFLIVGQSRFNVGHVISVVRAKDLAPPPSPRMVEGYQGNQPSAGINAPPREMIDRNSLEHSPAEGVTLRIPG